MMGRFFDGTVCIRVSRLPPPHCTRVNLILELYRKAAFEGLERGDPLRNKEGRVEHGRVAYYSDVRFQERR